MKSYSDYKVKKEKIKNKKTIVNIKGVNLWQMR